MAVRGGGEGKGVRKGVRGDGREARGIYSAK